MTQPIHPMLRKTADRLSDVSADHGIYLNERIADILARAAIQALMEPDEGMVEAGEDAMIYPDGDFIRNQAETVFQAMLKPLLGDEGTLSQSEEKPRQPVPGIYGPDQGLAPEGR